MEDVVGTALTKSEAGLILTRTAHDLLLLDTDLLPGKCTTPGISEK